ncbi:hypothetical protein OF376_00690 [Ureaplasma miroungigenitalium]|uniref:DNA-directed DNA polymerase n=1 Tax=Ureaplasma miroungigenitalium TaxID=1042321 RepID=A0ABT3BM35_9BACT|nr:hypothetical protein [Ureaplasma miroungigenitalium]MCV3728305.1 hypothetical protein [Ureaplasma miroungigenitalium]MCV3734110.1 hypothetical protein [Ureaplasma miroungigenitalium]
MNNKFFLITDTPLFVQKWLQAKSISNVQQILQTELIDTLDAASQELLFATTQTILVKDTIFFKTLADFKNFQKLEQHPQYEHTTIIFVIDFKNLSRSAEINNFLKDNNGFFDVQWNEKAAREYVMQTCQEHQIYIDRSVVNDLVNNTLCNRLILEQEMNKLICSQVKKIDAQTLLTYTSVYEDSNIFQLINFLFDRNYTQCFSLLQKLKYNNFDENIIITTMISIFVNYLAFKKLMLQKKNLSQVMQILELSDFQARRYQQYTQKMSYTHLYEQIKKLIILDNDIKSSKINKILGFYNWIYNFWKES